MSPEIFEFIGKIIAIGGGAAAAAYGIFVFLGKKWIENKFSERLEAYKHEQYKELQGLKYKIDTLFNRVSKIHEKEFEILPQAWVKLQDALGLISKVTNLFQSYPGLNDRHENELTEFLSKTKLTEFQKKQLLSEKDKDKYYVEVIFWHDLHDAEQGLQEFHNYIIRNRIFLSPDLQDKFKEIDDIMWNAFIERQVGEGSKDRKLQHEAYKKIRDNVDPIRNEIEAIIQKRLRFEEAE